MKSKQILLVICALMATLLSCSSDDDIPLEDRTTEILGQWTYQTIVSDRAVDLNGDNESNLDLLGTQELKQCIKDNVTTFTENGPSGKPEYGVTESNLACDNNDPFSFVEEDFWSLGSSNTVINFENREPFRIVELTKDKLVVETDDVFENLEYVITITFKKK